MARADSIPPFPADIDRDAFGHWLSGFTDGEGCFHLCCQTYQRNDGITYTNPMARFTISLRADDLSILELARAFLACGTIGRLAHRNWTRSRPGCPTYEYCINKVGDLVQRVIPHFSRYPLRAKKARDFAIWKEAVALMALVSSRPARKLPGHSKNCWRRKWNPYLVSRFLSFRDAIRLQRVYQAPAITPIVHAHKEPPGLFDHLT